MTSKAKKRTPPESDTAMVMCNLVSVETHSKVSPISSRSRRPLVNDIGGKKQSTLESYIDNTCSERKQSSHLKPQIENSGISTELSGSLERPESSLPESLTKTNHKNIKRIQQSSDLQTNSKRLYSKKKQTSSGSCFTEIGDVPNRDDVDGEVFEDYFSPANNALKQRFFLFGSTPERSHMPAFDLNDSNKRKGKRSFGKKRKHENIDIKDLLVGSSGPAPETHEPRPECLSVVTCELPRFEEIKLEASAKKQRTQTRLSSAVLSEGKKRKSSIELNPGIEKNASTATSPVPSSAVNVNLQIQNCLETAPDPKHAVEKRQMGLKSM